MSLVRVVPRGAGGSVPGEMHVCDRSSLREVLPSGRAAVVTHHANLRGCFVGDKSPKSKDRQKKQDAANKGQKQTDAYAKAHPTAATLSKKGK